MLYILQVRIGAKAVTVDDFFKKNFVNNLALLLGCDPSLIRFMEVISASGSSRRRRRAVDDNMQIVVEIGNNPAPTVPYTSTTNNTNATQGSTPTASQNSTGTISDQPVDKIVQSLIDSKYENIFRSIQHLI